MRSLKERFALQPWAVIVIVGVPILLAALTIGQQLWTPRTGLLADAYIREIPYRSYAANWGMPELMMAFLCIILGVISTLAGAVRTASRLPGRKLYLVGAFALLFGLNVWALTEYSHSILSPAAVYFLYWFTYFTYSPPIIACLFLFLSEKAKARIWPLLYAVSVYSLFSVCLLLWPSASMEIPADGYTVLMVLVYNVILLAGVFSTSQRRTAIALRIYAALYFVVQAILLFMLMYKPGFYIHDSYKNALAITVFYMLGFLLYDNAKEMWEIKRNNELLELRNQYVQENYTLLQEHRQQLAKLEHELRHQLIALEALCREEKYSQLLQYLKELQNSHEALPKAEYSGNPILDALLARAVTKAAKLGFVPGLDIGALPPLAITDGQLVSLFANLLENALEACEKMSHAQNRLLRVKVKSNPPYLYVLVENSFEGFVTAEDGKITTSKTGEDAWKHGHGLQILEQIASQYEGFSRFEQADGMFRAEVAVKCIERVE